MKPTIGTIVTYCSDQHTGALVPAIISAVEARTAVEGDDAKPDSEENGYNVTLHTFDNFGVGVVPMARFQADAGAPQPGTWVWATKS